MLHDIRLPSRCARPLLIMMLFVIIAILAIIAATGIISGFAIVMRAVAGAVMVALVALTARASRCVPS